MKWLVSVVFGAFFVSACGSTVSENGVDGGAPAADAEPTTAVDGGADDARDASPEAAGPLACGTTTCGVTEYCIVPCSGGVLPVCIPPDNGACPSGTQSGMCLGDSGPTATGCVTSPPPPYCSASPTCNGGQGRPTGRRIDCVCA